MSAAADPLASIGTPVGAAPPPPSSPNSSDPLASIGTPVSTSSQPTPPAPTSTQADFDNAHPVLKTIGNILDAPAQANIGAVKNVVGGVGGILQLLGKYGVVPMGDQTSGQSLSDLVTGQNKGTNGNEIQALKEAGDYLQQHAQLHGWAQKAGGATELIGELLSPLGLEDAPAEGARALSFAERMGQQAKVAKFLSEHRTIATLLAVGARATHAALKTAAETGAQTFVHTGGDAGAAGTAAAIGGVGGAVLTPAAEGVSALLRRAAPATETIAGEEIPTLSSQRPGTGARGSVTIGETPKVAAAQQAGAPRAFRNLAQRATKAALDEANQGRIPPGLITDPARLLQASEDARPYAFTIPGMAPVEGTEGEIAQPAAKRAQAAFKAPSFVTSSAEAPTVPGVEGSTGADLATSTPRQPARDVAAGGGDLVAADPETAQMHLSRLNDLIDHPPTGVTPEQMQSITDARDGLQEQMDMYHSYQRTLPNFQPIDSARAAASVGHFGEAADQLQNAAQPIYQKIDAATDGEFNTINRSRAAAMKRGDFTKANEYESRIQQMIQESGAITPAERIQANKLWSTSMVLDGLNNVIDHAANVSDTYAAQVRGGRLLAGQRMQNGLQRLIDRYGTDRLESVVGKDGMENMTRLADLLQTPEKRSAVHNLSMSIFHNIANGKIGGAAGGFLGHHLAGWEGAVAGSYAGAQAERMVLRMIATSPQAGKLFDYAVRNNVTPKVATGLISSALVKEHEDDAQQQEHLAGGNDPALGTRLTAQALRESGAAKVPLRMPANYPISPDLEDRTGSPNNTTPPLAERLKSDWGTFTTKAKMALEAAEGKNSNGGTQ